MRLLLVLAGLLVLSVMYCMMFAATTGLLVHLFWVLPLLLVAVAIRYRKPILKWIFPIVLLSMSSCNCHYVASDKIGVWVENYGKDPSDYSMVYGKFPTDAIASTWAIEYPGTAFGIPVDPLKITSIDQVSFTIDPSVLISLIRTDEACRKYAFKFKANGEGEQFVQSIQQIIIKETVDACRYIIQSNKSDTLIAKRSFFESNIQNLLAKKLEDIYGMSLDQFSCSIEPPSEVQQALNNRMLAEQQVKQTLASMENARALVELAKLERERAIIESQGLTPQVLEKMRIQYAYSAWQALAASQNKAFVPANPNLLIPPN